jgi:hypothetical protein
MHGGTFCFSMHAQGYIRIMNDLMLFYTIKVGRQRMEIVTTFQKNITSFPHYPYPGRLTVPLGA